MPRIKSAAKRMRQARSRATLNRTHRSQLRTAVKKVKKAIGAGDKAAIEAARTIVHPLEPALRPLLHRRAIVRHGESAHVSSVSGEVVLA